MIWNLGDPIPRCRKDKPVSPIGEFSIGCRVLCICPTKSQYGILGTVTYMDMNLNNELGPLIDVKFDNGSCNQYCWYRLMVLGASEIDRSLPVQTRARRPAKIIEYVEGDERPIIAQIQVDNGESMTLSFLSSGHFYKNKSQCPVDLVNT